MVISMHTQRRFLSYEDGSLKTLECHARRAAHMTVRKYSGQQDEGKWAPSVCSKFMIEMECASKSHRPEGGARRENCFRRRRGKSLTLLYLKGAHQESNLEATTK
jgi:hypothetical protein